MLFLSGCQLCVRMGYTLPQVIKEEKKDEERVGNLDSKREKVEKAESEEEKQERRFRGVWFSCFSFSV